MAEFDRLVAQIAKDARRRKSLTAADYYPPIKMTGGLTRELPLAAFSLNRTKVMSLILQLVQYIESPRYHKERS